MNNEIINEEVYEEEYRPIENQETYLEEMQNEFTTQKENCTLLYNDIKTLIASIEEEYPDINVNVFSDFYQIIEEYFSFFTSALTMVDRFKEMNENSLQNERVLLDYEETINMMMTDKENMEIDMKFKDERLAKLEEDLKLITNDYINLYDTTNTCGNVDENSERESKAEEEKQSLQIQLQKIKEEKAIVQSELVTALNKVKVLENEMNVKYIAKVEHDKTVKALRKELKVTKDVLAKNDISLDKLRKEIIDLCSVRDTLTSELNDKRIEIEDLRMEINNTSMQVKNESTHMKVNEDEIDMNCKSIDGNLDALLMDDYCINNDINNNNNDNGDDTGNTIKISVTSNDIINQMSNNKFQQLKESENNVNKHNSKIHSFYKIINNPYGKYASTATRKVTDDYYKQFFYLTYQTLKLNSDNISPFLIANPDELYKTCKKEKVPFHKYASWLTKTINIGDNSNNDNVINVGGGSVGKERNTKMKEDNTVLCFISARLV